MRISQITEYLSRSHRELCKIAEKEHSNVLYLWYDFIKCSIVHGAIINHYCRGGLYKLKGCERRKSLTYRRILKLYDASNNQEGITILNNKHLFNRHFESFIKRKWLYSAEMDFDGFCELCNCCAELIVKPEDGVEGVGISKILSPSAASDRRTLFDNLKKGSYMIEECIKQHPSIVYNNSSVNTVRAHTMMDLNGDVHIMKMLLRVGVGDSVVDNYAHGGCVYELDAATGHIISPSLKKDGSEVYVHPGTDTFVLGRGVPNWDKVIEGIKSAHKFLPQCRFIGWDVAVTTDGIELIEGNHNPDYELLEFFGSKGWWNKFKEYV